MSPIPLGWRAARAPLFHFAGHSVLDRDDFFRSGLELADRRLTTLDIQARMDLRQAVLAYLSSCDSGVAVPGRSDELMALVRVFLLAGCPSVLASLWPLQDAAAADFAKAFYAAWTREGVTLAQAFREATLATRATHDWPHEWAPFALFGAWSTTFPAPGRSHAGHRAAAGEPAGDLPPSDITEPPEPSARHSPEGTAGGTAASSAPLDEARREPGSGIRSNLWRRLRGG